MQKCETWISNAIRLCLVGLFILLLRIISPKVTFFSFLRAKDEASCEAKDEFNIKCTITVRHRDDMDRWYFEGSHWRSARISGPWCGRSFLARYHQLTQVAGPLRFGCCKWFGDRGGMHCRFTEGSREGELGQKPWPWQERWTPPLVFSTALFFFFGRSVLFPVLSWYCHPTLQLQCFHRNMT